MRHAKGRKSVSKVINGPLSKIYRTDTPYGCSSLFCLTLNENDKKSCCFSRGVQLRASKH